MEDPEFYILGAPRSGTRTLSSWLDERGDITLEAITPSPFKSELCITRQPGVLREKPTNTSASANKPRHAVGVCEWQLYTNTAVPRIAERSSDARFVICLHDPAEVAWALHSNFLVRNIEHVRDFKTAWALGRARQSGRGAKLTDNPELLDYASICSFGRQVARLLTYIPAHRIHFVFLEDLRSAPAETWRALEDFLDLPHVSRSAWPVKDFLITRPAFFTDRSINFLNKVKNHILPWHKNGNEPDLYKNGATRRKDVLKPVPQNVRQQVSDMLSEDIAALSVLTNRDLTHWIS